MGNALRRSAWWLGLGLLVAGCGGGGGGGGLDGLLFGTYHFVGVDGHTDLSGVVQTQWGRITADGAGSLDANTSHNDDTSVGGPDVQPGIPYSVAGDRTLSVLDPTMPGSTLAVGRVASNGGIALLGSIQDGEDPGLFLALRRSGTFNDASLDGDYAMCVFVHDDAADENGGDTGGLTFDGAGGAPGGVSVNRNGVISGAGFGATYTVAADGGFTLSFGALSNFRGGVLEGTNVIAAAGNTFNGEDPFFVVFVRLSAGASDALLNGSYFLVSLEYDVGGGAYRSVFGTLVADGAGGYTTSTRENVEGTVSGAAVGSAGTYAVAADGGLTLHVPGATLQGAVSPGGSFAVASGGVNGGENPMLYVLLR